MKTITGQLYWWCYRKLQAVYGAILAFVQKPSGSSRHQKQRSKLFLRVINVTSVLLMMCPVIMRVGGSGSTGRLPSYTYTGTSALIDDGDGNWQIRLLSSGTLVIAKSYNIDIFMVGGGGGGTGAGGGGGYTATYLGTSITGGAAYNIVVGAGGAAITSGAVGNSGGTTSGFGHSVSGGEGAHYDAGGDGGSGGSQTSAYSLAGGSDGEDGWSSGSTGQHTTTREFGESTGTLYSTGGGSYGYASATGETDGADNTGDGAGGRNAYPGYHGGSGILIIRNQRVA